MIRKIFSLVLIIVLFLFFTGNLSAQTLQELRLGTQLSVNLIAGEERWYSIRITETCFLFVETFGTVDTYLEAYDASDNLFADNNDYNGLNARLGIIAEAGKTYRIKLRNLSAGGLVRIRASSVQIPQQKEELRPGSSISGNLRMGQNVWYSLRSAGNGAAVVETSGNIDTVLRAYDASYKFIDSNNDSGVDKNAKLEIYVESGKTYFFRLTAYDSEASGPYSIRASFEATAAAPTDTARNTERSQAVTLRPWEDIPVVFDSASESRWYRFEIPGPGTLFVVQTRGHLDTILRLYDSRGTLIAEDDDSGDSYNARISASLDAGIVFIEVREYDGNRGVCTIHAEIR